MCAMGPAVFLVSSLLWVASSAPIASPAGAAPPAPAPTGPAYDRQGFWFSLGAGAGSCGAPTCASVVAAGLGRGELGYRWPHLALVASTGFGGALPAKEGGGQGAPDGHLRIVDAGGGIYVFLLPTSFVDPYLGVSLGYSRVTEKLDGEISRFSRGALRPSVGFDFLVSKRVALGPRFDMTIPFAGKFCTGSNDDLSCTKIKELLDQETKGGKRRLRRAFPKPWFVSFQVRFVL